MIMRTEKQCSFGVTIDIPTGSALATIKTAFSGAPGGSVVEDRGSALVSFPNPSGGGRFAFLIRAKNERELSFAWPQIAPPLSEDDCFRFRELITRDMLGSLGAHATALTWSDDPQLVDPRVKQSKRQVIGAIVLAAVAVGIALLVRSRRG